MYCANCGVKLTGEEKFCANCGVVTDFSSKHIDIDVYSEKNEPTNTNIPALVGFIFSIFLGWLFGINLVGFILSIIGLFKSKKLKKGMGMAITGIVISLFWIIRYLLLIIGLFTDDWSNFG